MKNKNLNDSSETTQNKPRELRKSIGYNLIFQFLVNFLLMLLFTCIYHVYPTKTERALIVIISMLFVNKKNMIENIIARAKRFFNSSLNEATFYSAIFGLLIIIRKFILIDALGNYVYLYYYLGILLIIFVCPNYKYIFRHFPAKSKRLYENKSYRKAAFYSKWAAFVCDNNQEERFTGLALFTLWSLNKALEFKKALALANKYKNDRRLLSSDVFRELRASIERNFRESQGGK